MKKVAIISIFHICIPFPGGSIVLPRYCRNRVCKNKNQILFATPSPAYHYQTKSTPPLIIKQIRPASHYQTKSAHPSYEEQADCLIIPLQAFCHISSLPLQASCYIFFFLTPSGFLLYFFLPYPIRLLAIFTSSYPFTLPAVSPSTKNFWQEMKTMRIGSRLKTDRTNT